MERAQELVRLIEQYQKSYYAGNEEISDAEFDSLWDELRTIDPSNPIFKKVGSDLQGGGGLQGGGVSDFPKCNHIMHMGSQEKCTDEAEIIKWVDAHPFGEYLVEYKFDGASLELQYKDGCLQKAVTRGDGVVGDEITSNALRMQGVMRRLDVANGQNYSGAIRGEVLMSHSEKEAHFADAKNCRNAAAGLMKRLDGKGSQYLTLVVYDAVCTSGQEQFFTDEAEKIDFLRSCGFVASEIRVCKDAQEIIAYRKEVEAKRDTLPFDIDGLVVKGRAIDLQDMERVRPEKQVAFKFDRELAQTILREVEWSTNGATYTPVAIFDEVSLCGTQVSRASLANPDTIAALGVKVGDTIEVCKRGEIIPKVERVVVHSADGKEIAIPTKCESCSTSLQNTGSRVFCPNPTCQKRVVHQIQKWVNVLKILEIGNTLIEKLTGAGIVKRISDLYRLDEDALRPFFLQDANQNDKKSKGAARVIKSLQASTTVDLATFVGAFDIEGVGVTMCEKLVAAGYDTLQKVFDLTSDDVARVDGFAQIKAKAVVDGIAENRAEMEELATQFVHIKAASGERLAGKSFCFTGELHTMKRAEAQEKVKAQGGVCKASVTKGLTYLVTNDTQSGSAKNKAALKNGTAIIDEAAFLAMVGQ